MIEYLGKEVEVKIDRPIGSKHPTCDIIYPLNYGFIEGAIGGDREEIDAYVLGEFEPLEFYRGKVIGIIKRRNDVEDKLVIAKEINSYDKDQIKALTEFQERFFDIEIITLDYLRSSIRNTVRGLIIKDERLLVLEEVLNNVTYYYLPGGGINFLETSEEAIIREIKEELKTKVIWNKPCCTLTNIFEIDGIRAHEITQIYYIEVEDIDKIRDDAAMTADLFPSKIKWISKEEFNNGRKTIYPKEIMEFI